MPAPVKKSTQEKYTHIITDFLKQNSLISVNALEKAINAPQSTIAKSILNESVLIPEKHIFNILRVLSYYGIKIDGYTIEYEEDIDSILYIKIGEVEKTIEVKYYEDGSEKEIDITNVYEEDDDTNDKSTSSSFYYLHRLDKYRATNYLELL